MRRLLLIISGIILSVNTFAQNVIPNFTIADCNGGTHTLYDELDNGKVIVLVWVMPCPACVSGGKTAFNIVQSYASTYPGKVFYYLLDDVGDNSCSALSTWATANGIDPTKITILDNTGNVADQNDFGGYGMPHIIVVGGGQGHRMYFSGLNNNADDANGIQSAINMAMFPASISPVASNLRLSLFPNPVGNEKLTIQYNLPKSGNIIVDIVNVIGKKVLSTSHYNTGGNNREEINVSNLPNGIYFLKLYANDKIETLKFTIAK